MSPASGKISLLLCVVVQGICTCTGQGGPGVNSSFPAVFSFGDSILDTGNNNGLRTLTKCNFPPYGKDFPGGRATGRFSNGKVPSDLIVEALGIKDLLPAYLDPALSDKDIPTGVGFASGGSGLDPLTASLQGVISVSEQLNQFREYIDRLKGIVGEANATAVLNNALFLISAGNNDIAITYLSARLRIIPFPTYSNILVNDATDFIQALYDLGARRFIVLSTLPLGCLPSARGSTGLLCADVANQAAQEFNTNLSNDIAYLAGSLQNATVAYVDVYGPFLELIQNPGQSGFVVSNVACCGGSSLLCTPFGLLTCPNPSNFVFWDSAHPTERAYRVAVAPAILRAINSSFVANYH
ncbi:hypothetical protein MLD38_034368 [Melastoma candidum]|uniref:Uncharacterized protein n=1 Tax=Melastoma candidum TaxID=119954 RepID=A0ACB9MBJ7_9MYRT|nr:hypothetical protein MLD38_034368 [Melastoma candidum]